MLRLTAISALVISFALPALAEPTPGPEDGIVRAPVSEPVAQQVGNVASRAGARSVGDLANALGQSGQRGGRRGEHRVSDCERLVLAMDHVIALLHDHEGPIPSPSEPVSELNDADVLLGGMVAVKNLCGAEWAVVRDAGGSAGSANTRQRENPQPDLHRRLHRLHDDI